MLRQDAKARLFRVLGGAAALLLAVTGTAAAQTTVRVGLNGVISDAPIFIAEKRGFFREEGIAVTFVNFDSGPKMVAPLGAGQLDVAAGATSAGLFNAAARGLGIKIVADKGSTPPGPSYMPLLIRKDLVDSGRVKSFADLKGLKIAEAGQGGSPGSTLNEILKQGGLTYGDVQHLHNLGYPQHVAAFANKAIDGAITTEPSVTQAVEAGYAVRFSDGSNYPGQQIAVLLYGADFIAKQRDAAQRFMNAYVRGVRVYNDALVDNYFKGPTAQEVIDVATEKGSFKDKALFAKMVANGCDPDGRVNMEALRKDLAFFKAQGYLEGETTVEAIVDNSFVEAALAKLGPYRRAQ